MVRVIDSFACARLERKAACHDGAVGRAERIENGLCEIVRPDVGGERFSVDDDVDPARKFVWQNLDSRRGGAVLLRESKAQDKKSCDCVCGRQDGCGDAHVGSVSVGCVAADRDGGVNVSEEGNACGASAM